MIPSRPTNEYQEKNAHVRILFEGQQIRMVPQKNAHVRIILRDQLLDDGYPPCERLLYVWVTHYSRGREVITSTEGNLLRVTVLYQKGTEVYVLGHFDITRVIMDGQ
jgi:hypothetical protein